jgi:hypothetical protein
MADGCPHGMYLGWKHQILSLRFSMTDEYDTWLKHVFDRPVRDPAWYFDIDEPDFKADAQTITELVTRTMLRSGTDLLRYSDSQVNQGLSYIFNNACSDIVFAILDGNVPFEQKMGAIRSIKMLYKNCFTPRCAPVLGHIDEPGANPLNAICYMLWDVTPLTYWEKRERKEDAYAAIFDVLKFALTSTNPACVESALHGLGHMHYKMPRQVEQIIQRFLSKTHIQNEDLSGYARQAYRGYVL